MSNEISYSRNFMAQQQIHQCDLSFNKLCLIPFIFHYSSSSCRETMCLFFQLMLSLSSVPRCHNINFKALCTILKVLDKYRYDTPSARYERKVHWSGHGKIDIYTRLVNSSHFVLQPYLCRKNKLSPTPLFSEVLNQELTDLYDSSWGWVIPNITVKFINF